MKELEKLMSCDLNYWDFNKSWIQFVSLFILGAKKTAHFFSMVPWTSYKSNIIAYLWMGSFCVPNTDGKVFWSSHKLVFSNLHIRSTSNLGLINYTSADNKVPRSQYHTQTINKLHLLEKKGEPKWYNKSRRTCFRPHRLGLVSQTGTANLR